MPQALLILIGIIIIPSLYAWLNIVAFWDPYGDTKDVRVAVVNLDTGASSPLTGSLDVGTQVVAQLKENDQLGWQFMGLDAGMRAVKSGDVYATIVIPKQFSKDLLSLTTGDFVRPKLEYFVNEKANAIAPKITDVGATTLETKINSTFVSTVSQTVTTSFQEAGDKIGSDLLGAQTQSLNTLSRATAQVSAARSGIADIQESLSLGEVAMEDARAALVNLDDVIGNVRLAIGEAQGIAAETQSGVADFTSAVTDSYTTGAAQLTEISAKLNERLSTLAAGATQANGEITTALNDANAVIAATRQAISELQQLQDALSPTDPLRQHIADAIASLQERNSADTVLLQQLSQLNSDVSGVTQDILGSASALNIAVRESASAAGSVRDVIVHTLPEVNRSMNALSTSAGSFSAALDSQKSLVSEAAGLLDAFETQLEQANSANTALDTSLAGVEANLRSVQADVGALSSADVLKQVEAMSGLNPGQIAEFMASPVQVKEKVVFSVATYGSAMAPLFTNLSLWIAAFVLVVLLRQEVDTEGIDGLTVRQAYFGRWMLLAFINFFQALLVSVGNVVIGVQMASAVAFVATSVFIGFVYMALIYSLAVSFGYVGKGLIILLVIMQIPGASGIYPIQMMPSFFQALFPFFPFTYGIDALRETVGGFYGGDYWKFTAVLGLFAALSFVLGLFFRQRLGNFSRLFNRRLSDTNLFVSENVQVLGSRRRLTQLVQALTDRQAFRTKVAGQAQWFADHHLSIMRIALLSAVVTTALLACLAWVIPEAKATVLALWGVLCLLVIALVVTLEYVKQNIAFATQVGSLQAQELQSRLAQEERAIHSNAQLDKLEEQV
ncbi:YhgE/Pip domain-containing protein [Leucobacter luti]|uniref:YhgE/Pip domain-containing protein n=1 Tax=Leucobacter luti TaxID=340320 RepID=UPI001C68DBE5|nr:YhgE/Pip domain-containing protein [Leucobacter luti]QYM75012.1 YhgE/Pip domain-containing protein [Leucobacter luti]